VPQLLQSPLVSPSIYLEETNTAGKIGQILPRVIYSDAKFGITLSSNQPKESNVPVVNM
jgi:hypothetical protein